MKAPIQGSTPARRFTPQHQADAARARHAPTRREQTAFENWLDTAWRNRDGYGSDIRRFVSVVRQRIYQRAFSADYTVTPATLCDWVCRWRRRIELARNAAPSTAGDTQ